jgi:hypothetical protein
MYPRFPWELVTDPLRSTFWFEENGVPALSVKAYLHFARALLRDEISSVPKFGVHHSYGPALYETVTGFKSQIGNGLD